MAEHEVLLYIYDLSQGLAAQLSLQMTGRHFPGIWHTAVVVPDFGSEVFYGQGISIVSPGTSHHGQPLEIQRMGTTAIDKDTFLEYIEGIRETYTGEAYSLLSFNCNNFSDSVISFLTGNNIPQHIIDLPKEFLSTPLGQSMRPMIENMYTGGYRPDASQAVPELLNNNGAMQPGASRAPSSNPTAANLSSPLSVCTNLTNFQHLLSANDCLVVMFTSQGCPPCHTIKPTFEDLAMQNAPEVEANAELPKMFHKKIGFAIVDTQQGQDVARHCGVSATPTFQFYLKGQKNNEVKGANVGELKMQTVLLLDAAYPPHPHTQQRLPELQRLSSADASFSAKPNFEAALARLQTAGAPLAALNSFRSTVVAHLSSDKFAGSAPSPAEMEQWSSAQNAILDALPPAEWFPLLDLMRYAATSRQLQKTRALSSLAKRMTTELPQHAEEEKMWMLGLRFLSNVLHTTWLDQRDQLTTLIIEGLLHTQSSVRTSAATCAFKAAQLEHGRRVVWLTPSSAQDQEQEGWEIQLLTAVLESIKREDKTETRHRLIAALGLLVYFSPYDKALQELFKALDGSPGFNLNGRGHIGNKLDIEVLALLTV